MATTESLLDWQSGLFEKIFFQDNDKVATDALEEALSKDVQITINGTKMDYSGYTQAIHKFRAAYKFKLLDFETLLTVENSKNGDVLSSGSIVQKSRFSEEDASGKAQVKVLFGITVVEIENGNRKVVQMTEVENDAE